MRVSYAVFRAVFVAAVLTILPAQAWPGEASALAGALAEANSTFTYKGQPIHPGLIKTFQNWESDYRPPITVSVDVGAAQGTNEYAESVEVNGDGQTFIDLSDSTGRFAYKRLGRLDNNIHVLHTWDKSDGTGIFQNVMFVRFRIWRGFDRDGLKASERLLMSIVRVYPLVGAKTPDIQIESHGVVIHSDSETVTLEFSDAFTSQPDKPTLNIANPASLNCAEVGGRLESRTSASGGEYAMCHLPNGSVCEEWALFRKECP